MSGWRGPGESRGSRRSRRSDAAAAARYERGTHTPGRITGAQADAFAELTPEQATIVFEHFLAASDAELLGGTDAGSAESGGTAGLLAGGAGAGGAGAVGPAAMAPSAAAEPAGNVDPEDGAEPPRRGAFSPAALAHEWPFVAKVVAAAAGATLACGLLLVAFAPRADSTPGQSGTGSAGTGSSSSVGQLGLDRSDPLGTSVWSSDW